MGPWLGEEASSRGWSSLTVIDLFAPGVETLGDGMQLLMGVAEPVPGQFDRALPDVFLQSDDEDDSFLAALIGFGIGLVLIYKSVDTYRKSRLIKDTSTARIRSMAVGRTEVEGVAHAIETTVRQPFTEEECLYASYEIEEYTRDNDDDWSWDTVESGAYTEPFHLEDETGRVVVDAEADAT